MSEINTLATDVLIIGSGAAELSLALRLADRHHVVVLSKSLLSDGSTAYAQGGIAAVFDKADSIEAHIDDTLVAGAGLCDRDTVAFVTHNARHCVQWLADRNVIFDHEIKPDGTTGFHLTRESGHSHRRIVHAADATGKALATTLIDNARRHPGIRLAEHAHAIDIILSDRAGLSGPRRAVGLWVWDRQSQRVETWRAKAVVLATGGAANVYHHSTNPDAVSGDGLAMAWRAGCRVSNLEFNQFHPTTLCHPQARSFLLTEALRGEGAFLVRPDGSRFMPEVDSRAELAPRDVVARAIDNEMKHLNTDCLFLDISHRPTDFIHHHFPMIHSKLLALGIDLTTEPVPVVPAAHYTCGGVMVDKTGLTDVNGLYAIGEVACTGLHGANRLASNSLLECLVYGWSAANHLDRWLPTTPLSDTLPIWRQNLADDINDPTRIEYDLHQLRTLMWAHVAIVRTTHGLEHALGLISLLKQKSSAYVRHQLLSEPLLKLRSLTQVAELMVRCALQRKESRGLHYTLDYPVTDDAAAASVLQPDNYIKR